MYRLPISRSTVFGTGSIVALAAAMLLSSCGGSSEPLNAGKITAYVSVPPQATLVSVIGGEHVVVEILAGAGKDPHDFSPSPKQAMNLGRAEVWFTTRMPFERSMAKKVHSNARRLRIVDTTEGQPSYPASQPNPDESAAHDDHHGHDHDHAHDHSDGDPHLWLSPPHLKLQAEKIAATLAELAPEHGADFQANLTTLESQIDQVHAEIDKDLAPYRGATFLAYHGAFAWFADAYGLKQEAIEFGGRSPETKRLRQIIENARATGIRAVFTQPQFDRRSAEAVAKGLGGSVIDIDPLAEDLFGNLRHIAEQLGSALSAGPTPTADTPK